MNMSLTKKRDMAKFYKNVLTPLGFSIQPLEDKKTTKINIWKPKEVEAKEFEVMGSSMVTKKIKTLTEREEQIKRQMVELKKKAVEILNNREPNELTSPLYTGTYGKNVVPENKVAISSSELIETQLLIKYLTDLRLEKQQEELANVLEESLHSTNAVVVVPLGGPIKLEITF